MLFGLLNSSPKNEGGITAQRKHVCHCATKTGRGIGFPGHYLPVTVIVAKATTVTPAKRGGEREIPQTPE